VLELAEITEIPNSNPPHVQSNRPQVESALGRLDFAVLLFLPNGLNIMDALDLSTIWIFS